MTVNKTKKSVSSRVDHDVHDLLLRVSKDEAHRFYDRKVSYIVANILKDWYHKEVNTNE